MKPGPDQGYGPVSARAADATRKAGRDPGAVRIVAVSKCKNQDAIVPVLKAGHRLFGENRVQEAADKWPALRGRFADIELHLIGPLQTNKIKDAVALFDAIQTVDRPKLAHRLAEAMARTDRRPRCYIQVNTGEEPRKAGVPPTQADAFIEACCDDLDLPVVGLMCIPPVGEPAAPHFALLRKIAERHGLTGLSMGMSGDFEEAIRFGATLIRIGTAIFGSRG